MIKCSIIIPHYNSTTSLIKLLDTIPNNKEVEILVIDDHSDEAYIKQLALLKGTNVYKNISFYNNEQERKGAGACRNIGLKFAKGKWILFADSDDYFVDDFFNVISSYFNNNSDVIFFKPTSEEIDTRNLSDRHIPYAALIDNQVNCPNSLTEIKLRYFFLVPWSKLIRKKVILDNEIKFDEVIASNDIMFSVKLGYYMIDFEVSTDIIYCVTRSKGTLTTTINENIFNSRMQVFIDYYDFLKQNLSKENFKLIKVNVSGRATLVMSFSLGLKKTLTVFKILRKKGVHFIDMELLNPLFLKRMTSSFIRKIKWNKKWLN